MESRNCSKIVLIVCWYGNFPWYFPFFIHSCSFNPTIDFIIITDNQAAVSNKPNNVKIIYKTISEIRLLSSIKLGFAVQINEPYKFCDLKPAYGFIFSDFIKKYNFWGHCDLDIIFGNIRGFLTEELLSNYDYISLRHDYTTGCFGLYRNVSSINNLFKRSRDYKKVFSENRHFCFDECNFAWDLLTAGKSIFELKTEIESFTHVIKRAAKAGIIKAHFDFILLEGIPGRTKFDRGKIIYKNTFEVILYHLYWLKKVYNPKKTLSVIPNVYRISPKRIYLNS